MRDRLFVLLVHDRLYPLQSLKPVLKDLSVDMCSVSSCEEAGRLITQTHPHIVFADASLPDGSWVDILNFAGKADVPLNVIVVGATMNTQLYLSTTERGAFDFLVPPFEREALGCVVRSAEQVVRSRREALARLVIA